MNVLKFNLLDKETEFGFMPTLTAYIIDKNPNDDKKRPAILVIPGGGYGMVCADREGERIALAYSSAGFQTFILNYCVNPHRHPLPILNAATAIEIIRENAEEWDVDTEKIAVCGFSAGGHLAASISTLWNDKSIFGADSSANKKHRPDATILCYPVITSGDYAHRGTFFNLTGSESPNDLWDKMSLEKRVNSSTPPAFLFHTFADTVVPVENSLLYASALRGNKVPFEMHIYPDGNHGLALASDEVNWAIPRFCREYPWIKQSIEWLYVIFGITDIERN